jgi:hypothetical protein
MPVAGRLRTGETNDKGQPQKLSCWRATSHDRTAIEQIAGQHGGTPQEWGKEGQWEVVTETDEIPIVLPPDPLGGTPIYELWSAGGCQRRCDGVMCATTQPGPDGSEPVDVDCVCEREQALSCEPTTRLSVILPEVRFAGVWRIDTRSWFAAWELPGMVDMVQGLQQQAGGLSRGVVAIEQRTKVVQGQTRHFTVPVVRNTHSPDEIVSGRAALGAMHDGAGGDPGAPEVDAAGGAEFELDATAKSSVSEGKRASDEQVQRFFDLCGHMTADEFASLQAWLSDRYEADDFRDLSEASASEVLDTVEQTLAARGKDIANG